MTEATKRGKGADSDCSYCAEFFPEDHKDEE